MKKILTLLLILPLLLYCAPQKTEEPKEDEQEQQQKPDEGEGEEQSGPRTLTKKQPPNLWTERKSRLQTPSRRNS